MKLSKSSSVFPVAATWVMPATSNYSSFSSMSRQFPSLIRVFRCYAFWVSMIGSTFSGNYIENTVYLKCLMRYFLDLGTCFGFLLIRCFGILCICSFSCRADLLGSIRSIFLRKKIYGRNSLLTP